MLNTSEVPQRARRIEELVAQLEATGDPAVVSKARELVEALMDLHGAALSRMLEIASRTGAAGKAIADDFGSDDLVGSLLVLYGLHPLELEERVRRGVEKLSARLRAQGSEIELVRCDDGIVHLRAKARESAGCGSNPSALRSSIEEAVFAAAPDAVQVIIEGLEDKRASGFVPLESLAGHAAVLTGAKGGV